MSAFHPSTLFSAGEGGVIYDAQTLSTMRQDSAGTVAAAIDGPVGYLADLSGNGHHAVQSTAGKRPTLKQSGGTTCLEFDGVDDCLRVLFPITQPFTRVMLIDMRTWVDNSHMVSGAASFGGAFMKSGGIAELRMFSGAFLTVAAASPKRPAEQTPFLSYEVHNGASSAFRLNQDQVVTGNAGTTLPAGITLGATQLDAAASCRIYGVVEIDRALTPTELDNVQWWLTRAWHRVLAVDGDSNILAPSLTARSFAYQYVPNADPPVFLQNLAVAGSGLDVNTIDLAMPARASVIDARIPTNKYGRQYVYFPWWSNNLLGAPHASEPLGPGTHSNPESTASRVAIFLAARKAAGWDKVGIGTIVERSDSGQDNRAFRASYNSVIAAPGWIQAHGIDFLVDFAADPVMGAVGMSLDPALCSDGVHFTATGHAHLEAIFRAALNGLAAEPTAMTFPELATFDASTITRAVEALTIHVAEVNVQRPVPFATAGAYLTDVVRRHLEGLVQEHFTVPWLDRIAAALPNATDQQIDDVARDLAIDLTTDVPA